jgi:hypothetical protein
MLPDVGEIATDRRRHRGLPRVGLGREVGEERVDRRCSFH